MPPSAQGFTSREFLFVAGIMVLILAVLGWLALKKVEVSSQDKAVMCPIRQLSAAADQYFLENGVSTARYEDLVGATNYVKAIATVAGETYPTHYTLGITITVTGVAGVRTVTYAP